jgi:hypothetical protein
MNENQMPTEANDTDNEQLVKKLSHFSDIITAQKRYSVPRGRLYSKTRSAQQTSKSACY